MAFHNKLVQHRFRSPEVDDEIATLVSQQVPVIIIARQIPIGERHIRCIMKERGLSYPKKINQEKLKRKKQREAKHEIRKQKEQAFLDEIRRGRDDMRADDVARVVSDLSRRYAGV